MSQLDVPGDEVRALWATKQYTMRQLADHFGVSRQAIHYHLKTKPKARAVLVTCDGCGKEFIYERKRGRPGKFFCASECAPANPEVWQELAKEILE